MIYMVFSFGTSAMMSGQSGGEMSEVSQSIDAIVFIVMGDLAAGIK